MAAAIDVSQTIHDFKRRFREIGTADRARAEKAYMKSALQFHGVTLPDLRRACAEFCKGNPDLRSQDLRALVDALYKTDYHDLRTMGLLLLEKHRQKLAPRELPWLIDVARRSQNWAHVDLLATKVIGNVISRTPNRSAILRRWGKDPDFWVRRFSFARRSAGCSAKCRKSVPSSPSVFSCGIAPPFRG